MYVRPDWLGLKWVAQSGIYGDTGSFGILIEGHLVSSSMVLSGANHGLTGLMQFYLRFRRVLELNSMDLQMSRGSAVSSNDMTSLGMVCSSVGRHLTGTEKEEAG